jgi:hypothetical protein
MDQEKLKRMQAQVRIGTYTPFPRTAAAVPLVRLQLPPPVFGVESY